MEDIAPENSNVKLKRRLILFVAFTIVFGWAVFLLIPCLGLTYGENTSVIILAAAMFIPAFSSLLVRLVTKEGFKDMYLHPNFKGHMKEYLLVFFGPTLLLLVSAVFYFLIFPGSFDPEFKTLNSLMGLDTTAGTSVFKLLAVPVLQIAILGPVINIIPTMGEELGWRGYLLPKLRRLVSDRAALIITGVIWGIWHLPVIVMGHNYGTDYAGYPWLGILAMIIFCVVLGTIEGYATIKLESAIPAAMIHSTVNAGAAFPIIMAQEGYNTLLGPAITGLVGGFPFLIVAVVLFLKVGKA